MGVGIDVMCYAVLSQGKYENQNGVRRPRYVVIVVVCIAVDRGCSRA